MIITARDFRANQSRYIGIANSITFDKRENMLIEDARNMTATDIEHIRQKDDMTVEESQMLLLRMIDEEYQRP